MDGPSAAFRSRSERLKKLTHIASRPGRQPGLHLNPSTLPSAYPSAPLAAWTATASNNETWSFPSRLHLAWHLPHRPGCSMSQSCRESCPSLRADSAWHAAVQNECLPQGFEQETQHHNTKKDMPEDRLLKAKLLHTSANVSPLPAKTLVVVIRRHTHQIKGLCVFLWYSPSGSDPVAITWQTRPCALPCPCTSAMRHLIRCIWSRSAWG